MRLGLFFLGCLSILSCQQTENEERIQEVRVDTAFTYADIIRNPITANQPIDTTQVAKFDFRTTTHEFGTVKAGAKITKTFSFKNTGNVPLLISDARSSCGCTVPSYPEKPIQPGRKGTIKVVFDTENKIGVQKKPVTITANTYPSETILHIIGEVTE